MIMAFMYVARAMPARELAEMERRTATFFGDARCHSHSYSELVRWYKVLLGPHNIHTKHQWVPRCRVWRLVFLMNHDGYWDPTSGIAFSLAARRVRPSDVEHLVRKKRGKAQSAFAAVVALDGDLGLNEEGSVAGLTGKEGIADHCPLMFDHTAIEWSMPNILREIGAAGSSSGGDPDHHPHHHQAIPVLRVWTTMLAVNALLRFKESFLMKTEEHDGFEEPVVDRAMTWLETMCEESPELRSAFADLMELAALHLEAWELVRDASITLSRLSWNKDAENRTRMEGQRIQALMAGAVLKGHETFSLFLGPATESVLSWQRTMVICTALLVRACTAQQLG